MQTEKFHKLRIWQQARCLSVRIYRTTAGFPCDERFGLTAQMRRASVSVASNIAEGAGRRTTADLIHFLCLARGSVYEILCQCQIAHDIGLMPDGQANELSEGYNSLAAGISKCISSLREKLR